MIKLFDIVKEIISESSSRNYIKLFEQFITERIKASEAYRTSEGVQTVIDGKRDLAFISTMYNPIYKPNNENELAAMQHGLKNGLTAIEVKGKRDGRAWVLYKKDKKAAQKLADYAESKRGYLSDSTPEEAKYVGDLLGYDEDDIQAFIKRRYGKNSQKENVAPNHDGKSSPYGSGYKPVKLTKGIIKEKCWKGYKKKGMKTMFGKKYPNCVKK